MGSGRSRAAIVLLSCLLAASAFVAGAGAGGPGSRGASPKLIRSAAKLANRCVVLRAAEKRFVSAAGDSYAIAKRRRAARFHLKPTALGVYLLHDTDRRLMAAGSGGAVVRDGTPSPTSEWRIRPSGGRGFTLTSIGADRGLRATKARLTTTGPDGRPTKFRFLTARRCKRYPEAQVGARGSGHHHPRADGSVFGFADLHMHVTANL